MSFKSSIKTLLVIFAVFGLLLFVGKKTVKAAPAVTPTPTETPTPTPTSTPSCQNPNYDLNESAWVYALEGGSRSQTVVLTDPNGGDCGTTVIIQYPYCVSRGETAPDETVWAIDQPEGSTPGQCPDNPTTETICNNGQSLEVPVPVSVDLYQGFTVGLCPTPTPAPTPLSCSGDEHLDASGTNCVTYQFSGPQTGGGGGVTSTGQVLGASTLAATGTADSKLGIALMILGGAITLTSIYAFKKNSL